MKILVTGLLLLLMSLPVMADQTAFSLKLSNNTGAPVAVENVQAIKSLFVSTYLPNTTVNQSDIPLVSYKANGSLYTIKFKCGLYISGHATGNIFIDYDIKNGIQAISGYCIVIPSGKSGIYFKPEWDNSPHGNIVFTQFY